MFIQKCHGKNTEGWNVLIMEVSGLGIRRMEWHTQIYLRPTENGLLYIINHVSIYEV
jgi:hypothetical protein